MKNIDFTAWCEKITAFLFEKQSPGKPDTYSITIMAKLYPQDRGGIQDFEIGIDKHNYDDGQSKKYCLSYQRDTLEQAMEDIEEMIEMTTKPSKKDRFLKLVSDGIKLLTDK